MNAVKTKEILNRKIYTSTTENIRDEYRLFNFTNKDVLTVTASGDQAFNALYLGANSVDTFDNNPNTEYFMRLREGAIKAFEYYDFIDAFYHNLTLNRRYNKNEERKTFEKIARYLNYETICFWCDLLDYDQIYSFTNLLSILPPNIDEARRYNYYLSSEEDYEKLREILKDKSVGFTLCDVFDIPSCFSKSYNMIFLSNIINYVDERMFLDFVFERLPESLKNNGLTIWYEYSSSLEFELHHGDRNFSVEEHGKHTVAKYYFESYFDPTRRDHISVYKKERTISRK